MNQNQTLNNTSSNKFDSNSITPGTEFMSLLSKSLRAFIRNKMETDLLWSKLKVILSGSEVPGGNILLTLYAYYIRLILSSYFRRRT